VTGKALRFLLAETAGRMNHGAWAEVGSVARLVEQRLSLEMASV